MNPYQPRHLLLTALILFTGSMHSQAAAAQETNPEPAEDILQTSGEAASSSSSDADAARLVQAQLDRVRYEQIVAELENTASLNAYSGELTEAYLNLAGTLEVLEEHDEAAVIYDQALQRIRIGSGLDSLQQIPVLERLQENSMRRQDWEGVDRYAHLIYHITRRNYPVGDERRLQALDRLGKWKLKAAGEELAGGYRNGTRDAASLYSNELRLIENTGDFPNKGIYVASLHLGEARGKLAIARQVLARPLGDYRTTSQQTITTQRCRLVNLGDGRVTRVCETVEVPNMDYYLDPSARKLQEISQNLLDVRRAITEAYDELQKDGDVDRRNSLLAEMQEVTKTYNAFVTDNGL